jgi:tetratricopeptide (TPR) repeat protein
MVALLRLPVAALTMAVLAVCQSDDLRAVVEHAEQARAARDFDGASTIYRDALAANPEWAEGWWRLGTNLYETDDFANAAQAFAKAVRLQPQAGIAVLMLGLSEAKIGHHADALEHIRAGKRFLTSDQPPQLRKVAVFTEGLMLLHGGQFEEAQTVLGKLAAEGVADEDLTVALGLSVLRIRPSNYPAANATARRIVTRAGQAELASAQNKSEALESYRGLAKDFADVRNVQFAFGRYLLNRNREDEAIEAFKREVQNSPSHLLARLAIAEVSLKLHLPGGLEYARQAAEQHPEVPLTHALLGELLLQENQVEPAVRELEMARDAMPKDARIYWTLARAYMAAGRLQEAEQARVIAGEIRAQDETASASTQAGANDR